MLPVLALCPGRGCPWQAPACPIPPRELSNGRDLLAGAVCPIWHLLAPSTSPELRQVNKGQKT